MDAKRSCPASTENRFFGNEKNQNRPGITRNNAEPVKLPAVKKARHVFIFARSVLAGEKNCGRAAVSFRDDQENHSSLGAVFGK